MQPHDEFANTLYQELTLDEYCRSISSTLHTHHSGHAHHRLLPHYYSQFDPQQQKELSHEYEHVYQPYSQHPHQFQASQQEHTHYLGSNNNGNRYCEGQPYYWGVPNCCQPQDASTARVSFWKAFNTVLCDAKEKQQQGNENERCLVSELEAVEINSHTVASTVGVPLGEELSEKQAAPKRRAIIRKKKRRSRKGKEEMMMGLMSAFFKRLVKRVVNHQEVIQNKILEVIERMDRERAEREEAWRRRESEIYEREAAAKAHERDLASIRESSIVSCIEKITGQRFKSTR